jgi:hypothetical protein
VGLGALTYGHDLGTEQIDTLIHHHFADIAQQPRAVRRDDLEH